MTILEPPRGPVAIARQLGPGLILAASIVGSGELIATTKVGAEAGFLLLWLIVLGCVIKVFTQVELGRATVTEGKTALESLDGLPGPRPRVGWAVWLWLAMTVLALAQQGGIVGGVGQALAIAQPLTERGIEDNRLLDELVGLQVEQGIARAQIDGAAASAGTAEMAARISELEDTLASRPGAPDALLWSALLAVATSVLLLVGRYRLIQTVATALVGLFTLTTVATVLLLQRESGWAITSDEVASGLSFQLPKPVEGVSRAPLATALAAFGIIGVGSAELIMYPYWCLEKGYARWTGPREDSAAWRERARGWMRVLRWDAWVSALVYTFATVAFYLLGAAVLGRAGLNPSGDRLIRTLAEMYQPVFGDWAPGVFLVGSFCVLYSTFFVTGAGFARLCADGVRVFRLGADTPDSYARWVRIFSGLYPLVCLGVYAYVRAPAQLVLASGVAQSLMLPVLGFAALWLRYRRIDPALRPSRLWDAMLWLSFAGFLVAGAWTLASRLFPSIAG
ncbi:MAG: Nramp family divalent metal transporter [Planctomycetota bacterium]